MRLRHALWLLACWASCAAGGKPVKHPPPVPPAVARPAPVVDDTPALSSEAAYHYLQATLLMEQGDAHGAVAALREARVFDHASAVLPATLARALLLDGQPAQALSEADRAVAMDRSSVDGWAARAEVLWSLQRLDEAEPALREWLQRDPARVVAARRLMDILLRRGDVKAAEKVQARILQARPDDEAVSAALLQACLERGITDCALREGEAASRRFPASAWTCVLHASVLDRAARFADGAAAWQTCVGLDPDDPAHRQARLLDVGRSQGGRALQDELKGQLSDLDRDATAQVLAGLLEAQFPVQVLAGTALARTRFPKDSAWELLAGSAWALQGRCKEAEPLLALVPLSDEKGPDALRERATCALRQQDAKAALALLPASDRVVSQPALVVLRCRALAAAHKEKDALAQARALPEKDALFTSARAQCLHLGGDPAAALEVLNRTLMDAPEDPALLRQHAAALWEMGRAVEAQQAARALHAVQPGDPSVQNLLAYSLLRHGGDVRQALKLAQAASQARPDSAEILDTLGVAQLAAGENAHALATLERAAQLLPYDAEVWLHVGDARRANAQEERAVEAWRTARALLPLDPAVLSQLAARP